MRPTNKKAWTKLEETKSLEITASKLSEGTEYLFRVAAQNVVGVGDFVELQKPATPKSEFGEPTDNFCQSKYTMSYRPIVLLLVMFVC